MCRSDRRDRPGVAPAARASTRRAFGAIGDARRRSGPGRACGHASSTANSAEVSRPIGFGVAEADRDALDRRIGVEGQPGRAGLGDGDLRDQQFGPARHPQADDRAGSRAVRDEAAGDRLRGPVDLGIGESAARAWSSRHGTRAPRPCRRKSRLSSSSRTRVGTLLPNRLARRSAPAAGRAAFGIASWRVCVSVSLIRPADYPRMSSPRDRNSGSGRRRSSQRVRSHALHSPYHRGQWPE